MVYVYLSLDVKDQAVFETYREVAGDAMKKHTCKVLSVGRNSVAIDGDVAAPTVAVILTFETEQDVKNWIADPEIELIHEMRRACGDLSIMMVA